VGSDAASSLFALSQEQWVSLLRLDPELGRGLSPGRAQAARSVRARVLTPDVGRWHPEPDAGAHEALGVLVVDGVLCRSVTIGHEGSDDVMGTGDVFYPWAPDVDSDVLHARVAWEVLTPARLAVLDRDLMRLLAPFPEVIAEIVYRYGDRSRTQAALTATAHVKRVDIRLLALFWRLAERFGTVTPEGVVIPIRLTHSRLARIVGAQRPSVTTALNRMVRDGRVLRTAGEIVLSHDSIETLDAFAAAPSQEGDRIPHH
jgi:CRP/FNR family transcriptional regulator, cyclic AMP receptor protein